MRRVLIAAINAAAHLAERVICAFPNDTHQPLCRDCKVAGCKKGLNR